jgi:hypothetical protein
LLLKTTSNSDSKSTRDEAAEEITATSPTSPLNPSNFLEALLDPQLSNSMDQSRFAFSVIIALMKISLLQ